MVLKSRMSKARIWREAIADYSGYCPGTCREALWRRTMIVDVLIKIRTERLLNTNHQKRYRLNQIAWYIDPNLWEHAVTEIAETRSLPTLTLE
jgi:hypothetical protein